MKQVSNIDMRTREARTSKDYLQNSADFFALFMTAGTKDTIIGIISAESLAKLIKVKEIRRAFAKDANGLKWKGLAVNHVPAELLKAMVKYHTHKGANEYETGTNGTRSTAQEQETVRLANLNNFMNCNKWEWTATQKNNDYIPDVTGIDANGNIVTIEVKGFNGRLF